MKRMCVWIIEAHSGPLYSRWTPVTNSPLGRCAHRTRWIARKVAKRMQRDNMYNIDKITVRYRVRKYEAA